jgi:hypothetical protein
MHRSYLVAAGIRHAKKNGRHDARQANDRSWLFRDLRDIAQS